MSDSEDKRNVVRPQSNVHPEREKMSAPFDELVATEKKVDAHIKQLKAQQQLAREKFHQETRVNPPPAEQISADMENEVERARQAEREHESESRERESIEDESNRDHFADGVLALAEKYKHRKRPEQVLSNVATPTQPLQANVQVGTTDSPTKVELELPLQFDYGNKKFIDCNGQESKRIPLRFTEVLQAWFARHPLTPKKLRLELSYEAIGALFVRGRVKKKAPPDASADDILFREKTFLKAGNSPEDKKRFATRFATDFTRWLKNSHGVNGKKLFFNDEKAEQYKIARAGWHRTRPMINHSEATKRHVAESNAQDD